MASKWSNDAKSCGTCTLMETWLPKLMTNMTGNLSDSNKVYSRTTKSNVPVGRMNIKLQSLCTCHRHDNYCY